MRYALDGLAYISIVPSLWMQTRYGHEGVYGAFSTLINGAILYPGIGVIAYSLRETSSPEVSSDIGSDPRRRGDAYTGIP